jgi:hypothetical protein
LSTQPTGEDEPKNIKKSKLAVAAASLGVVLALVICYFMLLKIKSRLPINDGLQEQFVGTAQISEQLQSECQKSAEKIISLSDSSSDSFAATESTEAMFAEYRQNAENCREVYFSVEGRTKEKTENKIQFRNEGAYADLIVDIALLVAKTNKPQAVEMLNFAKKLATWEFYMGPVVCNSNTTLEAYLESLNLPAETTCYKPSTDKEKLFSEIKNKNFSVLSTGLNNSHVVSLGLINSDVGCPEKISSITSLSFVFKTDTENKLVLEFAAVEDCLQLQSVLVPEQQVNE